MKLKHIIDDITVQQKQQSEIDTLIREFVSIDSMLLEDTQYNRDAQIVLRLDELGAFDAIVKEVVPRGEKERRKNLVRSMRPKVADKNDLVRVNPDTVTMREPQVSKLNLRQLGDMIVSAGKAGGQKARSIVGKLKAVINNKLGKPANAPLKDVPGIPPEAIKIAADTPSPEASTDATEPSAEAPTTDSPVTDEPSADTTPSGDEAPTDTPSIEEPSADASPEGTPAKDEPLVSPDTVSKLQRNAGITPSTPASVDTPTGDAETPINLRGPKPPRTPEQQAAFDKFQKEKQAAVTKPTDEPVDEPVKTAEPSASPATIPPPPPPPGSPAKIPPPPPPPGSPATIPPPPPPPGSPATSDKPKSLMPKVEPTATPDEPKRLIPKAEPKAAPDEPKRLIPKGEPTAKPTTPKFGTPEWTAARKQQLAAMSPEDKAKESEKALKRVGFTQTGTGGRGIGDRLGAAWKGLTAKAGEDLGKAGTGKPKYKSMFYEIAKKLHKMGALKNKFALHEWSKVFETAGYGPLGEYAQYLSENTMDEEKYTLRELYAMMEEMQQLEQAHNWWHKPSEAEEDGHIEPSKVHETAISLEEMNAIKKAFAAAAMGAALAGGAKDAGAQSTNPAPVPNDSVSTTIARSLDHVGLAQNQNAMNLAGRKITPHKTAGWGGVQTVTPRRDGTYDVTRDYREQKPTPKTENSSFSLEEILDEMED